MATDIGRSKPPGVPLSLVLDSRDGVVLASLRWGARRLAWLGLDLARCKESIARPSRGRRKSGGVVGCQWVGLTRHYVSPGIGQCRPGSLHG